MSTLGFARILGIDKLNVKVSTTACSPCSAKPLDIMIVLDRTGSMCDAPGDDRPSNKCEDLGQARAGVRTFVSLMDPKIDRVGLAVTPPAVGPRAGGGDSPNNVCGMPLDTNQWFGYDAWSPWWQTGAGSGYRSQDRAFYVVSSLTDDDVDNDPTDDYVVQDPVTGNWSLNSAKSGLVQTIDCVHANGSTSYAMALVEAQHELAAHGRAGVQDVIVFFTDGGANVAQDTAAGPLERKHALDDSPLRRGRRGCQAREGSPASSSTRSATTSRTRTIRSSAATRRTATATRTSATPKEVCRDLGLQPPGGARGDRLVARPRLLHPRPRQAEAALRPGRRRPPAAGVTAHRRRHAVADARIHDTSGVFAGRRTGRRSSSSRSSRRSSCCSSSGSSSSGSCSTTT